MPRAQASDEVQILRFFEDAPLARAETLFAIVKDKMRIRSTMNPGAEGRAPRKKEKQPTAIEVASPPHGEAP